MSIAKRIFVGRDNELEQFRLALGQAGLIDRVVLANPGHNVRSRVFLPHGIGGMGKTELTQQCLELAKQAGWKTLLVDWELVGYMAEPVQMMNALAEALKLVVGEAGVKPYLEDLKRIKGVQEKAQRFRDGHPEEWQKFVHSVRATREKMPEPISKTTVAVIGEVLDYGPKALAKFADLLVARRALKQDEAALLTTPDLELARHLVQAIVGVAKNYGLVLALDTCEVLSLSLEEFLRDHLICPAVEQTTGLLCIVAGRYSQNNARVVEGADGQQRRVKGYADRLSNPPPTVWNLAQFAEPEIEKYLRDCDLDPNPDLVAYVQDTAHGVPFAVQLLVSALHDLGPERVRQDFPANLGEVDLPSILQQVVQRFLHYCLNNPTDQNRVKALALLRDPDPAVLRAVWQLPETESPRDVLTDLQARYGFIQSTGNLHEVVRSFLRHSLRSDDGEAAQRLGVLAQSHYLPLWEAETTQYPTLADRATEPRWQTLTLNTLNALCWSDERAAIRFLAGRALEALEFNWGFAKGLLKLAREFREVEDRWRLKTIRQFDALTHAVEGQDKDELAGLEALEREAADLGLDNATRCILKMWQASNLNEQGQSHKALALCTEVEKALPDDASLRSALAQRFARAGSALGFPKGLAIVSPEARTAYERAVTLAPDEAGYHVSLGGLCGQMGDTTQAKVYCSRAIELDPANATAFNNRGNAYSDLKDYPAALADYSQAIELNPQFALAFNNRGVAHTDLKDYPAALADYSQAIQLNPQYALAFYNRGNAHFDLKDYPAALADYSKAIELNPQDANAFGNRGLAFAYSKDYSAALADYARAIELDSTTPPVYNIACAHALQGNITQACQWLRRAIEMDKESLELARADSDFDPIREAPEFVALLKEFEKPVSTNEQQING